MNAEQKNEYLKDVHEAGDRIRQHVQIVRESPQLANMPTFERVALGSAAPMLEKNATTRSGSTLEMWEENVDQRLNAIDEKKVQNLFSSGSIEEMDF